MFTVYGMIDPRTSSFVYVGETSNFERRQKEHRSSHRLRKTPRGSIKTWLKNLHQAGHQPLFIVLDVVETEAEAKIVETKWIEKLADVGMPLHNRWEEHEELIQNAEHGVGRSLEPLVFAKGHRKKPRSVGRVEANASKTGYRVHLDEGVELAGPVTIDLLPPKTD